MNVTVSVQRLEFTEWVAQYNDKSKTDVGSLLSFSILYIQHDF